MEIIKLPKSKDGGVSLEAVSESMDNNISALIVQSPNYFGQLEDWNQIKEKMNDSNALLISVSDPIAL